MKKPERKWNGLKDLEPLLRPIESLKPDPMNARKHDENNIRVIKNSLETLGQHRPAVIQENNIVTVGNGMIEAAKALGWTHIACIQAQDDPHSAILRALVDNQSAELADWDMAVQTDLLTTLNMETDFTLPDFGFELEPINEEEKERIPLPEIYDVIVTCADEIAQADLLNKLTEEGYNCRALIL